MLTDRVIIGSVGRLVDAKNYRRLIKAFALVAEKIPEAHLILVGDGVSRSQLERETVVQGVESKVSFIGEVSRDEVYAALHQLDLFIMPSLWEGFCVAVVEAMAAGKPIVCSNISTLREVVGEVGTYFDPRSTESIAETVLSVLDEGPGVWREREQACRKRAKEKFSLDDTANSYIKLYNKYTC